MYYISNRFGTSRDLGGHPSRTRTLIMPKRGRSQTRSNRRMIPESALGTNLLWHPVNGPFQSPMHRHTLRPRSPDRRQVIHPDIPARWGDLPHFKVDHGVLGDEGTQCSRELATKQSRSQSDRKFVGNPQPHRLRQLDWGSIS